MGERVKRVSTPVSESEMIKSLVRSWRILFGKDPFKEQIFLLLAQNSLETGHRKLMYNYNVGNITTDGKGSYNYYDDLTTDEQVAPGKWEKKNLKYRAYESLDNGVTDYLKFLANNSRYASAWQNIVNPDPKKYVEELKKAGYFTANLDPYLKSVSSLFEKYNKTNEKDFLSAIEERTAKPTNPPLADKLKVTDLPKSYQSDLGQLSKKDQDDVLSKIDSSLSGSSSKQDPLGKLDEILGLYEKKGSSSFQKKIVKLLPKNNFLIKINSDDNIKSLEFSSILCRALDDELVSKSFIHQDKNFIEIECSIAGPKNICYSAINQVANIVKESFYKISNSKNLSNINIEVISDKKSAYKPITLEAAESNHRKFLIKFIEG